MGIEAITAKILNDAAEYADQLVSEAKAEADKIIAAARLEADEIKDEMKARGSKETAMIFHRKNAEAELEARKMRLATKQELVANAAESAVDWLAGMDHKDKTDFLIEIILKTGIKEGDLVLNEKDKKSIGKRLVKAANEKLEGGRLTLSDRTMGAKGGFILKYGAVEINATLEVIVASVKEITAPMVVRILFREHFI